MKFRALISYMLLSILVILMFSITVQAIEYTKSDTEVKAEEILKHIENGDDINIHNCSIVGELDTSNLRLKTIPNPLYNNTNKGISNVALFDEKVRKNLSVIESNITIINSHFSSSVIFSYVLFNGSTTFNWTDFNYPVYFTSSVFNNSANFSEANFYNFTSFQYVTFNSSAYFQSYLISSSKFHPSTFNFNYSTFNSFATFRDREFNGPTDFTNVIFWNDVDFTRVKFNDTAYFNNSDFYGSAKFYSAKFNETNFWNSNFYYKSYFLSAYFFRSVKFSPTIFHNFTDFRGANFYSSADFRGANFYDSAYFLNVNFYKCADFRNTSFSSSADFSVPNSSENISTDGKTVEFFRKSYINEARYTDSDNIYYNFRKKSMEEERITSFSKLIDVLSLLTCGFGTKLENTFFWIIIIIFLFAGVYRNIWIFSPCCREPRIYRSSEADKIDKSCVSFWECLYFSFNTFTRLGSTDWRANDDFRKWVTVEGILGWVMLAITIATLNRLLLRPY